MKTPTARKLPSGSWRVRVMVDGQSRSITAPTKREAEQEAIRIKTGAKIKQSPSRQTLGEAMQNYIDDRKGVLSASTIMGYSCIARTRFEAYRGFKCVRMDSRTCQRMVTEESKLCSPKTLKNAWGFVASVLKYATGETVEVQLPQVIHEDEAWLDKDQIRTLMDAVEDTDIEVPVLLGLHSVTRSEMLAMTYEDIDLTHEIIHVHGAVVPDEHYQLVEQAANKTVSRRRDIPILIPRLMDAAHGRTGKIIACAPSTVCRAINRTCRECGLPEVSYHGLRRSFASLCYDLGISARRVRQLGGWTNDQTVLNIYTKISKQKQDAETEKLRSFFR